MKYLKLAMNALAAVFLALFEINLVLAFYHTIENYPGCLMKDCPSHYYNFASFIVFSFLVYKTGKYLYSHFFEQKKFYVHLFLLSVPFLMLFASAAWYYADLLISHYFTEVMSNLYKAYKVS